MVSVVPFLSHDCYVLLLPVLKILSSVTQLASHSIHDTLMHNHIAFTNFGFQAIGQLKQLSQLDISENKLEDLPEEIGDLTSLTDFHLSMNLIERLPDSIGKYRHLVFLRNIYVTYYLCLCVFCVFCLFHTA